MTTKTPRPLGERLRDAAKRAKELSANAKRQRKREEDAAFLHAAAERAADAAYKKARGQATRAVLRSRKLWAAAGGPSGPAELTRSELKRIEAVAYAARRATYSARRKELQQKMLKARTAAKCAMLPPAERGDFLAEQERKQARRAEKASAASSAPAAPSQRAQERAARRAANKAAHAAKQAEAEAARNAVETAALIALIEARQGGDQ